MGDFDLSKNGGGFKKKQWLELARNGK